ncbi:MAG TPA: hypothetical protein VG011_05010 [Steroidobacteraceae bacterium]|jgi:hypothetical protein|nr:hypothetical protein [Steroidobacteraceae bacterium]HSY45161.1 hypothetical protein [Steroidobacteraceae bacterium]
MSQKNTEEQRMIDALTARVAELERAVRAMQTALAGKGVLIPSM